MNAAALLLVMAAPGALSVEPLDIPPVCVELPDQPALSVPWPPRLRLVWADVMGLAGPAFKRMAAEAGDVLVQAGLEASWRRTGRHALADGEEILVILLPRPAPGRGRVMGAVQRRSGDARAVWIYFDNVAWAIGREAAQVRSWTPSEWLPVARALGRVVAHEVLHLLAPDVRHSASGLMRAKLNRSTLLDPGFRLDEAFRLALRRRPSGSEAPAPPAVSPPTREGRLRS